MVPEGNDNKIDIEIGKLVARIDLKQFEEAIKRIKAKYTAESQNNLLDKIGTDVEAVAAQVSQELYNSLASPDNKDIYEFFENAHGTRIKKLVDKITSSPIKAEDRAEFLLLHARKTYNDQQLRVPGGLRNALTEGFLKELSKAGLQLDAPDEPPAGTKRQDITPGS